MISFPIDLSGQTIELSDNVLAHFDAHQQRRWWMPEAGGQLFARFQPNKILVEEATGPRKSDRRSRTGYWPDQAAEREEIAERYAADLHFVGDWHTHPERFPAPSTPDLDSISDCVRRSNHALNGFILVVVGQAPLPSGLHLSIHDGQHAFQLIPGHEPSPAIPLDVRRRRIRFI